MTENMIVRKEKNNEFKEVETKEDIVNNIRTFIEKDSADFSTHNVESIPSDIDGNQYYVLNNKENKAIKEIIRDGRKWNVYTQTTSKLFARVFGEKSIKKARKYKCAPQFYCYFSECPFKKRFDIINQSNVTLDEDGNRRCVSCSEKMEMITCDAEKVVAKSDNNKFILVKHVGKHKCLPKTILETKILEELEDFFAMNPTATRS